MQLFEIFSDNVLLKNTISSFNIGQLPHALLFLSIDEFTNINLCKMISSNIICESQDDFVKIVRNTHPDVKYYPNLKQSISVQDITDIYENIQVKGNCC